MAVILNIETSAASTSVALTAEGMVLAHQEDMDGRNQAALLSDYVKYCLDTLNDISTSKRDIILSELRKNGGNNALAIINSVQESP